MAPEPVRVNPFEETSLQQSQQFVPTGSIRSGRISPHAVQPQPSVQGSDAPILWASRAAATVLWSSQTSLIGPTAVSPWLSRLNAE